MGVRLETQTVTPTSPLEQPSRNLAIPPDSNLQGPAPVTNENPPELEASALDIDMIIQSFIRPQSKNFEAQAATGEQGESSFMNSAVTHPGGQGTIAPASPVTEDLHDYMLFDDMLFGFNGSPQDGLFGS